MTIRETIVTTVNAAGQVHIAPMGVREDKGLIILAPFKPSATLDNVLATGAAVVNYCDDVRVFAGCLTGRRDWPTTPATKVPGVRLRAALAHSELKLRETEPEDLRPRLWCEIVQRETHAPFAGFNRAQGAVLEAAILVSRLHLLPMEKIERELDYLKIAIDKTAGENERTAWDWLIEAIDNFRAAQRGDNFA